MISAPLTAVSGPIARDTPGDQVSTRKVHEGGIGRLPRRPPDSGARSSRAPGSPSGSGWGDKAETHGARKALAWCPHLEKRAAEASPFVMPSTLLAEADPCARSRIIHKIVPKRAIGQRGWAAERHSAISLAETPESFRANQFLGTEPGRKTSWRFPGLPTGWLVSSRKLGKTATFHRTSTRSTCPGNPGALGQNSLGFRQNTVRAYRDMWWTHFVPDPWGAGRREPPNGPGNRHHSAKKKTMFLAPDSACHSRSDRDVRCRGQYTKNTTGITFPRTAVDLENPIRKTSISFEKMHDRQTGAGRRAVSFPCPTGQTRSRSAIRIQV